ncbi:metallophosphoesterase family protein [Haloarcula laminariae]|uniref:metallophosphoesterase family protein n=1 Tax=Haloarcula laminariae TaxID=2961577 RepID=UPI0021C5C9C4|nr:metallophosphoesterase family protein [Halomicroarcula laminariae]
MLADDDFHDTVAPHHHRVDADTWDNIYVVGDVHGCLAELERLLERLDVSESDLLVFVGDLVTKGPNSAGVVSRFRDHPNMLSVRGNNEQKLLDGTTAEPSLSADDFAYLESLPLVISWDESMAVHGGVDPRHPLAEQDAESLLTFRSIPPENGYAGPFWFETYTGPPRVYFGHTVVDAPVETEWAVGLDTGCVYGGALTAYDTDTGAFTSVPAVTEYETRADRKWIDPAVATEDDD